MYVNVILNSMHNLSLLTVYTHTIPTHTSSNRHLYIFKLYWREKFIFKFLIEGETQYQGEIQ